MVPLTTVDGYIRVSRVMKREGDTFISPDQQRDQIEAWARSHNVTVAEWHVDLDESGAKDDRPGMLEAIRRVETGETQGIAVAKLDRFSRDVMAGLADIARVTAAGGEVVSIAEGVDPTTPAGQLMRTIMLAFAEWYLDVVTENWRDARHRAVDRGVHISPFAPFGYTREKSQPLEVDPVTGPVVTDLFRRRAAGATWTELVAWLQGQGIPSPRGGLWTSRALTRIIVNRAYLGEAKSGDHVNTVAHPALVDRATWEAAQAVTVPGTPRGDGWLLSGLLRCAGCRNMLKPSRDRTGWRGYRCRKHHSSGVCGSPVHVSAARMEEFVVSTVLGRYGALALEGASRSDRLDEATDALEAAEAELAAYRDGELASIIGMAAFRDGLTVRARRVDEARADVASVRRAAGGGSERVDVAAVWPTLDPLEQREVLRGAVDAVMLRRGTGPIASRAFILWAGDMTGDWPTQGKLGSVVPFRFPDDAPGEVGAPAAHDLH